MDKPLSLGDMRVTLDDVQASIIKSTVDFKAKRNVQFASVESSPVKAPFVSSPQIDQNCEQPYMKIILRQSKEIVLYEHISKLALKGTEEGTLVDEDNKYYEKYKSEKHAAKKDAISQTIVSLRKSRATNTVTVDKTNTGAYVSNFEMFDTYCDLEQSTQSIEEMGDGNKKLDGVQGKVDGIDPFVAINRNDNFKLALMLTLRTLAGNNFEEQQRRFRQMDPTDPLNICVTYNYSIKPLWQFQSQRLGKKCNAVADMCWCPHNGDVLAAAYGIYTYINMEKRRKSGYICIWNIKNPTNPERYYDFKTPVVSIKFAFHIPQLLAVGLFDGTVQVINITKLNNPAVWIFDRCKNIASFEPITALAWLPRNKDKKDDNENNDDEDKLKSSNECFSFLALSRNCSVTKFCMTQTPFLEAIPQVKLVRVEGRPEGIVVDKTENRQLSNCNPQGLDLCLQPLNDDSYYVLTDEGCIHRCSTNYPSDHIDVIQVHRAGVNVMEFSPWSPLLYLTCGNDWCVNIWMIGIFEPLITLQNGLYPIHWAGWSTSHSTMLFSVTRDTVNVWDLKRSTLSPMSHTVNDSSYNTMAKLSKSGDCIAVGREDGNISMFSFDDIPFAPHFQYDQLQKAIFNAIKSDKKLTAQVRNIGFFGYPGKRQSLSFNT